MGAWAIVARHGCDAVEVEAKASWSADDYRARKVVVGELAEPGVAAFDRSEQSGRS